MGRLEPEPIEAYKCPKCEGLIVGSKGEAQKHVDVPEDTPLPLCLVITDQQAENPNSYYVFNERGYILSGLDSRGGTTHTYSHLTAHFDTEKDDTGPYQLDSDSSKKKLKKGELRLLTEPEFLRFKQLVVDKRRGIGRDFRIGIILGDPEKFVRTTPELEALVKRTAPAAGS